MKIVFSNGKGGTGKTTTCMLIAMALAKAGRSVGVVDLDPQGSTDAWLAAAGNFDGRLRKTDLKGSSDEYTLIDTPPRHDLITTYEKHVAEAGTMMQEVQLKAPINARRKRRK